MSAYVGLKLLHLAAIAVWSAGLLYLPGLFAHHPAASNSQDDFRRLRHQTRLVFIGLMSPAAVIAVASGTILVFLAASIGGWMILKLAAVALMVMLHAYMGRLMGLLYETPDLRAARSHLLLLIPALLIISSVIALVSWKPI